VSIATLTPNPAVDLLFSVGAVEPGRKLRAREAVYEPGGGGVNVARGLQRLEVEAEAIVSKGGATGRLLIDLLAERNLVHRTVEVRGRTRVNAIAIAHPDGTPGEYLFAVPGPPLCEPETERWLAAARDVTADVAVLSGSPPPGGEQAYADLVAALDDGTDVVLDTSGLGLQAALDEGVFLVKPNRAELAALADLERDDEQGIAQAARRIVEAGQAEIVVVSLGAQGGLAVTRDRSLRVPAPPIEQRSQLGAGDSMVAGLVAALVEGADLSTMLAHGVAAGADAVRRSARQLCTREGTEDLAGQVSVHPLAR
jgi:6-phosphofructokinase 2